MKLLLDGNLSPKLVPLLSDGGHDVVHVRDRGLQAAEDQDVLEAAKAEDRLLISADTDFSGILAREKRVRPSLLLIRRSSGRRSAELANVLLEVIQDTGPPWKRGRL